MEGGEVDKEAEMRRHPSWIGEPQRLSFNDILGNRKLTVGEAVKALDRYITSKHTTSFGKQSMVSDPVAREDFIDWFIDVCEQCGMIQPTRPEFRQEYPT